MDAAYNAHQARRKNRSSSNLNHLTLAPLTTKLPINDTDMIFSEISVNTSYSTSYIQGKSAPSTPSLLARSPRSSSRQGGGVGGGGAMTPRGRGTASPNLPKSKSATHISSRSKSGTTTPGGYRRATKKEELLVVEETHRATAANDNSSDWAFRAGVLLSSDAREQKGQSWLVSRASSTSLEHRGQTGDDDEDAHVDVFEKERIARENVMASRHASRRGSLAFVLDEESPLDSRRGSEYASRVASRTQLVTPGEKAAVDYFDRQVIVEDDFVPGPDFVNLNERLEAIGTEMDTSQDDEAAVRRLVKRGHGRPHIWFGNILGFNLFSVEENDEEDNECGRSTDGEGEDGLSETSGDKALGGMTALDEQRLSPPKGDEGGWQDAAWLLTVASRIAWS